MRKHGGLIAKNIILAFAISLVFVFFTYMMIQSFYPAPEYEDYCDVNVPRMIIENESQCVDFGGDWTYYDKPLADDSTGYCDYYTRCSDEWNDAREPYERNVFIVNVVIGLIVLVLSFLLVVEAVSSGFMLGGVIMLIYGTIRYWGNLSNVLRTIVLGITLAILVWVGYKKLKD